MDEIKELKANSQRVELSDRERERIRKNAEKIIRRREREELENRRAEMEQFYELGLYARA